MQYRFLDQWKCVKECPLNTIPMTSTDIKSGSFLFRYCRGTILEVLSLLGNNYYVDQSSKKSFVELGTKDYPFKALDDAFRELFAHALNSASYSIDGTYKILIKHGSNLTMHSVDMPLIAINSQIIIE